jgi:hypothetical protein
MPCVPAITRMHAYRYAVDGCPIKPHISGVHHQYLNGKLAAVRSGYFQPGRTNG